LSLTFSLLLIPYLIGPSLLTFEQTGYFRLLVSPIPVPWRRGGHGAKVRKKRSSSRGGKEALKIKVDNWIGL
jgi:hypothetical protein